MHRIRAILYCLTVALLIAYPVWPQTVIIPPSGGGGSVSPADLAPGGSSDISATYATRAYVDAVAQGLEPKERVRAKSIAALPANTYANGTAGVGATLTGNANGALPAVDGITLLANERVLINDESAGADLKHGIYIVTQVGSAGTPFILTRALDMDTAAEIAGAYFFIAESGSTLANSGWIQTPAGALTVGTTALKFLHFNDAGNVTASEGLEKIGNDVRIAAGGVTSAKLSANAVTAPAIATGAVGNDELATDAVTSAKIASETITHADIAAANKDGAAATPSLRTLGTGAAQAAAGNDARLSDQRTPLDNSVSTAKIQAGAVTGATIATATIAEGKLSFDVATQAELDAVAGGGMGGSAGGDLSGTYPNPSVVNDSHLHSGATVSSLTDSSFNSANIDGLAAAPSLRTLGPGAQQATPGNDTRLVGRGPLTSLPGSPTHGDLFRVEDATSSTDCDTGGGDLVVLCGYDGATSDWHAYLRADANVVMFDAETGAIAQPGIRLPYPATAVGTPFSLCENTRQWFIDATVTTYPRFCACPEAGQLPLCLDLAGPIQACVEGGECRTWTGPNGNINVADGPNITWAISKTDETITFIPSLTGEISAVHTLQQAWDDGAAGSKGSIGEATAVEPLSVYGATLRELHYEQGGNWNTRVVDSLGNDVTQATRVGAGLTKPFVGAGDVEIFTLDGDTATMTHHSAPLFDDGVKVTFNPNATNPGLNFGPQAGDPSSLSNADCWYNSSTDKFRCREGGVTKDMIGGAGGAPVAPIEPASAHAATAGMVYGCTLNSTQWLCMTTAALLTTDARWQLLFNMPPVLATGCTYKLRVDIMIAATPGTAVLSLRPEWNTWAYGAVRPTGAGLASETVTADTVAGNAGAGSATVINIAAADEDKLIHATWTLNAGTLTPGQPLAMDLVAVDTTHTLTVESGLSPRIICE